MKPKRPLLAQAPDAAGALLPPQRRLLRAYAGVARARLCGRRGVAELFQIRLRPQSVGPANLPVSLQDQVKREAAEPRPVHGAQEARLCRSYEIYTIEARSPSISSGRYETLDADLKTALERAGVKQASEIPRSNITRGRETGPGLPKPYSRRPPAIWWRTGMRRRSRCSATVFESGGPGSCAMAATEQCLSAGCGRKAPFRHNRYFLAPPALNVCFTSECRHVSHSLTAGLAGQVNRKCQPLSEKIETFSSSTLW